MTVNSNVPMFLSDGTPVTKVKITSKRNIQVRVPASHPAGRADPLRIFAPATGAHTKGTLSVTLTNNPPVAKPGPVNKMAPLYLSDGTRVTYVKQYRSGNVQVRVPTSHALGAADPLRIFSTATGAPTKASTPLFLTNTPVRPVTASAPVTSRFRVRDAGGARQSGWFASKAAAVKRAQDLVKASPRLSPLFVSSISSAEVNVARIEAVTVAVTDL